MLKISSISAYWLCTGLLVIATVFYYPKWKNIEAEATISWDVSGYYMYLPGALIYKDLKELKWWAAIDSKYHPGSGMGQAFQHPSGNWVMKYPMGQALQFLPWFTVAHILAEPLGYPADGYSLPYQAAISWGSLLIAFLGLWFLRKILLIYFPDHVAAAVMICIVFGSNYLEYASVTGPMTHNWLFTLYAILIFNTIQFYRQPSLSRAALIGLLVGWATITLPTELISAIIPLFWGIHSWAGLKERFAFFAANFPKITLAGLCAGIMIFLQLAYWKFAAGEWIINTYHGQTFTWFPPHIEEVLWSTRAGWLVYSPMMVFAVIGIFMLRKRLPDLFPTVFCYCMIALYITSAWDIWWYGGSLGQRAMVQAYPLWAFGLGAFIQWASSLQWQKTLLSLARVGLLGLFGICIYLNIWWSHQAHLGGLFLGEEMNKTYLLKVIGRFDVGRDRLKLLDTDEEFNGTQRTNVRELLFQNFDADTTALTTAEAPISGAKSLLLNKTNQFSSEFDLPVRYGEKGWIRAFCAFRCEPKEWEAWKMAQFIVRFRLGDKIVKNNMIRLQRHVDGNETKYIFFDTRIPDVAFDRVSVFFWNGESEKNLRIDELRVESFE